MSINTFTVKAGSDGKAKFQIIIPIQYCTDDLFKDISLIVSSKNSQNIPVKKIGLQFEVEITESVGSYQYTFMLKKNNEQIDIKEITIIINNNEKLEKNDLILQFREQLTHLKEIGMNSIKSSYYIEKEDILLIGNNNNLELIKKSTFEIIDTLTGHNAEIQSITYDKITNSYLSAATDKIIRWDLISREPIEVISDYRLSSWGMSIIRWINNGEEFFIITRGGDNLYFSIFNFYDKNKIAEIKITDRYTPSSIIYHHQTQSLIFGNTPDNLIKVFSLADNGMVKHRIMLESNTIDNITIIPGGKYFMTHSLFSDHFKIWTFNEWKIFKKVSIISKEFEIVDVIFNNTLSELLIIYKSGIIDVYDWSGIKD